jgi:hypothetical protein
MTEDINKLISVLVETEDEEFEDEDASLAKEVSPATSQEVVNYLRTHGFELENHVWVKRMAKTAVTVAEMMHGQYSISYYARGQTGWLFDHRSTANTQSVIDQLAATAQEPVREGTGEDEDFDDEDEAAFEFKDVLGPEDKHEIYTLIDQRILLVYGKVIRTSHHYVHENSTESSLEWEWNWSESQTEEQRREQQGVETRIDPQIDDLGGEISVNMRRWNKKIYRELEAAYDDYVSDEQVAGNIVANEYEFDEEGHINQGELRYDQLGPEAQQKAREWWVQSSLENQDNYYAELVVAEWKWLLKNKGFDGVEINWSGFWSQGDGASFTASSIDLKTYLTGPDPVDFPEQERQQISENEEDDEDLDPKDVANIIPDDLQEMFQKAGFELQEGVWVKHAGKRLITAELTPGNMYRINYHKRGKTWWVFTHHSMLALDEMPGWLQYLSQIREDEDDEEDLDPKDVYDAPRRKISHIQTKLDYAEYEQRVADFFAQEGITNLSGETDAEGNTIQNDFSRRPCECCHRPLAGTRIFASGYEPQTHEIKNYWICTDCEYYAEYGRLDDTAMMDLKDDDPSSLEERYAGAEEERGVWYHGTSSALIPKILSSGLIPEPKIRSWASDETSSVQTTRKSLPGIYVSTNLLTATGAALRVAQRDKANQAVIVMELQPRSMVADEDEVNLNIKSIADHLSGSAYHHIWPYFMEVYGDRYKDTEDRHYRQAAEKQKIDWINSVMKRLLYKLGKQEVNPELEKRVKELLFNEGFRVMLERNVAYTHGWDLDYYKTEWSRGFGDYGTQPPLPNPQQAEDRWLAFSDRLARALKIMARPIKMQDWSLNTSGRVLTPIGFKGSNRIICIIEQIDQRAPEYHTRMLVHYGKPPEKLIEDWTQAIGPLYKPDDIIYKNQEPVKESEDDDDEGFDIKDILGDPPPDPVFHVTSSHGDITALVDDGTVTGIEINTPGDEDGEALKQIAKFDLGEWRRYYGMEQLEPNSSIDILDLGYWLKDGAYEPPAEDWRQQFAQERHKRGQPPPPEGI